MRSVTWWHAIMDAFDTMLFCRPADVIRLVGPAPMGGDFLEIVLDEAPLQHAMLNFSVSILLVSLLITGITAMLVFFSLHLPAGAADAAHHREHDRVPRRSGEPGARHR